MSGSIIDSFMGGSGFNIGDCNTDHCSFSVGKQKHVVRRSDFGSAAATGMEMGDKAMGAAKVPAQGPRQGFRYIGIRADRAVESRPL